MSNPFKSEAYRNFGLLSLRASLGATLFFRGLDKFIWTGIKAFVVDTLRILPIFAPTPLARVGLYAVPFAEITVGLMLILGCFTRIAAAGAAWILLAVSLVVTGIFVSRFEISPNVVYLGASLAVLALGPGTISLDRRMKGWKKR